MCRQRKAMMRLTLLIISIIMTTSNLLGIEFVEDTLRESETFHRNLWDESRSDWVPLTKTLTAYTSAGILRIWT